MATAVLNGRERKTAARGPWIVVVDDDERVRRVLRSVLESAGFKVCEAANEADLMAALKAHKISLITLDLSLRHEDGLAIARSVRATSDVPIIMITARAEDIDRIVGLELGADDYIVKPFNVREVLARVRAVLRRSEDHHRRERASSETVCFGDWTLSLASRQLTARAGQITHLTSAEFNLLAAFVRQPGRVLSRDYLIDCIGGIDAEPLERSIDTIVGRLRKKIESDPGAPQFVKTVRGAGYVFAA